MSEDTELEDVESSGSESSYSEDSMGSDSASADCFLDTPPGDESAKESWSSDADLEKLYESFDTSQVSTGDTSTATTATNRRAIYPMVDTPLYVGSQLSLFHSHLLIFLYALRHSLSAHTVTYHYPCLS